jgi:hypothetical protein
MRDVIPREGMSRLERCDATKATISMKISPYSLVSKPQSESTFHYAVHFEVATKIFTKRLGNQILGCHLSPGFPRNPKINKFHNVMTIGSF